MEKLLRDPIAFWALGGIIGFLFSVVIQIVALFVKDEKLYRLVNDESHWPTGRGSSKRRALLFVMGSWPMMLYMIFALVTRRYNRDDFPERDGVWLKRLEIGAFGALIIFAILIFLKGK